VHFRPFRAGFRAERLPRRGDAELTDGMSAPQLSRPRTGRVLAGVCAGLGRRFGLAPWLVRAIFLASLLLPGPQAVLYLVLWILIPAEG
jgi:phage shock protein PspC (stress-responsive transcriptional regulator)